MEKKVVQLLLVLMVCSLILVLPVASVKVTKIAFASNRDGNAEIYIMNTDGTAQTRLTDNSYLGTYLDSDTSPTWSPYAWSPDGTKIAFVSKRDNSFGEIYVMNADGSDQKRLTSNYEYDENPSWSPDGTKIAFNRYVVGEYSAIYVMDANGNNQERRTFTVYPGGDYSPTWSPDSTKIAFVSRRADHLSRDQIFVMNADGSGVQARLTTTTTQDNEPAWSPDGAKIAFVRSGQIYVMNANDGSGQTPFTNAAYGSSPAWSPEGTKIAFVRSGEIYVMNANDGSGQTNLTNNPAVDGEPAWGIIELNPPVAKAGADQTVFVNENVKFDGSGSTDSDGAIVSYAWNFGDTKTGSGVTTSHDYKVAGRYTVTLTVTDNDGLTGSDTAIITVNLPVKVRIVPTTLNIASKGKFVAFITLPSNYKAADVDAKSVVCEGATALRLIRIKAFPNTFAAIFNRDKLVNVKPGDKVKLTVTGTITKNGQKVGFSGSDLIKVINKKGNTKEAIDDVETMTDEKVFSQFNPR